MILLFYKSVVGNMSEWMIVIERPLTNYSAISWRVGFKLGDAEIRFVLDAYISWIMLAHMSPNSDILSWFPANQSLIFLLNDVCLAEQQQIHKLMYINFEKTNKKLRYVI